MKRFEKQGGNFIAKLLAQPGATQRIEFDITGSQFESVGRRETERRGRGRGQGDRGR